MFWYVRLLGVCVHPILVSMCVFLKVTALESAEDEKSCTAIAYLLSLAMVK